ncbi:hypothetical protein BDZ89DRAFT_1111484 [Hymenopellis radicata]|nr:hypothetical protein BDZ89DRAFT_1111484 [Hymenopellis radicata]
MSAQIASVPTEITSGRGLSRGEGSVTVIGAFNYPLAFTSTTATHIDKDIAMDPASNTVNRITDVVPANFLCDSQTLSEVAQSKLADETALSALDEEIPALEARLQQLKAETATLEQLIVDKANEQTRLRSSIAIHTSLLAPSPMRSLPGEILSEIFLYYVAISQLATYTIFDDIVAIHRVHTPILLVCRRWRTTALADPRLWTTIPLPVSDDGMGNYTHPLMSGSPEQQTAYWQALERRIEATSTLPLNLLFYLVPYSNYSTPTYAMSTFQTFLRLLPRADTISACFSLRELPIAIPGLASTIDGAELPLATHVHTARVFCLEEAILRKLLSAIPNVEHLEISTNFQTEIVRHSSRPSRSAASTRPVLKTVAS